MPLSLAVAICSPRYKTYQTLEPLPSLRVSVTAIHSPEEIEAACKVIATEAMSTARQLLAPSLADVAPDSELRQRKQ